MTDPRLVTVRSGAAVPVIYASDGPALLRNRDPAVTVYLGDEGMSPGDTATHILDALGTLSVTGDRDWWGITAAGSAIVQSTPGAVDSNVSPSQIAAQIALSGISSQVPALLLAQQTIAPNTSFGPINVAFPNGGSYLIVCSTTGGNSQIADIGIAHVDAQGNQVYFEEFNVGVGGVGNGSPVIIRGNLHAPNLVITGLTCTLPFLNGLGLINGPFTLGPLQFTVYSTALAVAETRPKMIPSNVQGGYLQGIQGVALAGRGRLAGPGADPGLQRPGGYGRDQPGHAGPRHYPGIPRGVRRDPGIYAARKPGNDRIYRRQRANHSADVHNPAAFQR